ncbi:Subtilisin-like serine protease [Zostera marina]|uniref:Subtilisin-like serine protease n=1 Tax=Zostera marina TaxID=29655 RepID=A0A0K9P801_ZOSMR|nr:Subtilisin-like serine protease [Zostera marina]
MKISDISCIIFINILVTALFSNYPQCIHSTDVFAYYGSSNQRRPYIVHVQEVPSTNLAISHQEWHESFLPSNSSQGLLFSYKHAMSGFAAMLTEEEVEKMSKKDGFLHAHPSKNHKLQTTHSPKFLRLTKPQIKNNINNIWRDNFGYGKGVIIGVLDTGISSNHPSFDDHGMPPPPKKWKGSCEAPITCNNKIIGGKSFIFNGDGNRNNSVTLPIDEQGHGTHTASTAAGQFVDNASVLGSAKGIASGISPHAHLAIYKVCGTYNCPDESIQAGIDKAMEDGVDVISLSLGSLETPLYNDVVSIGTFKAVKKGIFVSASAGNSGPVLSTLENASPWIFTVGASTIDRKIVAIVELSNGLKFHGESAYQPKHFSSSFHPLVFPQFENDENSTYCSNVTTLNTIDVKGKIVLCDAGIVNQKTAGSNVKKAGGVAMIHIGSRMDGLATYAKADLIPTSRITYKDRYKILYHYYKNPNITATIQFLGTKIGEADNPAPEVVSFSSRGPSKVTPGFVKPDVIGPGVNILAAWPISVGAFNVSPAFNIISGTSMSCPHLSGIGALLKNAHPDWSPTMIKSAIVTTSDMIDRFGNRISDLYDNQTTNFHVMGSGHVNVIKANNPGLVYDTQPIKSYMAYLCGLNYTNKQVSIFVANSTCPHQNNKTFEGIDLNYPSMVVELTRSNYFHRNFSRLVTNVGPNYMYNVTVKPPSGVIIRVEPKELKFSSFKEQLKFTVDVHLDTKSPEYSSFSEGFGHLTWISSDRKIKVRSAMVVTKKNNNV